MVGWIQASNRTSTFLCAAPSCVYASRRFCVGAAAVDYFLSRTISCAGICTKQRQTRKLGWPVACSDANSTLGLSAGSASSVVFPISNRCIDSYPEYHRLLPCTQTINPPRVEHLVVLEGGPVAEYICNAVNLPPLYVADLIHFGAVYYALVCPKPPPTAPAEQMRLYEKFTSPELLKERSSLKGKTVQEAQKKFRITRVDEYVEYGTYLRVYVHPRRFPRCYEVDWMSRILAVTESYVVLDKPSGTSVCILSQHENTRLVIANMKSHLEVGGTTNNIEECCVTFATRALGLSTPLRTTHQIDNCTEGCVVLSRTTEYCSIFHGMIREKRVKKLYLALLAAPIPLGMITHYMRPGNLAPRLISQDEIEGWNLCQLEVLDCKEVPWPNTDTERKHGIEDCGWPVKKFAYECHINLLTGRTHQIRAQLAAYGAPIVGDSMYMPVSLAERMNPGVNPYGNHRKQYEDEEIERIAVENWIAQHGKEPQMAIGLQACQISWNDGEQIYRAGAPWWR